MRPSPPGFGSHPLVSVVTPTFNRVGFLEGAVQSVLAQTYPNLELIVVDDGSEDGTSRFLDALSDPRARAVRLPHSGNIAVVRNAGAAAAQGTLLAFLDDDDRWRPEKLARQVERMAAAHADWSYTGYALVHADTSEPVPHELAAFRIHRRGPLYGLLTTETSATICSVVVRTALFQRVGRFDESLLLRQDHDLVLRLAEVAEPAALPEPLVDIHLHGGRTSAASHDPYRWSAAVYDRYLRRPGPRRHAALARRLRMGHLVSSAAGAARTGAFSEAARTLCRCAWPGAVSPRWWRAWGKVLRSWMPALALALPALVTAQVPPDLAVERAEFARWLETAPASPFAAIYHQPLRDALVFGPGGEPGLEGLPPATIEQGLLRLSLRTAEGTRTMPRNRDVALGDAWRIRVTGERGHGVVTVFGPLHDPQVPGWYPWDSTFVVEGVLEPPTRPESRRMLGLDGVDVEASLAGTLVGRMAGASVRLTVYRMPDPGTEESELMIFFRDATNGRGTYPAGRFLAIRPAGGNRYVADFNRARNPFCGYNGVFPCPAPWPGNGLAVPIEAGERYLGT